MCIIFYNTSPRNRNKELIIITVLYRKLFMVLTSKSTILLDNLISAMCDITSTKATSWEFFGWRLGKSVSVLNEEYRWWIWSMKLLIMQYSPAYYQFILFRTKCSPPVLKRPRSVLPLIWQTKCHTHRVFIKYTLRYNTYLHMHQITDYLCELC
jgi:hypothetical protein